MILNRHITGLVTRRVGSVPGAAPRIGEAVISPDFLNDPTFTSFPEIVDPVNRNALLHGGDYYAGGAAHPHPDKFLSALTYATAYNPITPIVAETPADPAFLSTLSSGPITL